MDDVGAHDVPLLPEIIFDTEGCCGWESQFPSGKWPPVGCPCTTGWSYFKEHMDSSGWRWSTLKKDEKLERRHNKRRSGKS